MSIPALFVGLVDDAAATAFGATTVVLAIDEHRRHRKAWYGDLVGPLLVPASSVTALTRLSDHEGVGFALVADTGLGHLAEAIATTKRAGVSLLRLEAAVAKRGEDPALGLHHLLDVAEHLPEAQVFAEIPLTWGLREALDFVASASARAAASFRVGGLAAELFPTAVELAGVICACRDRGVRFKVCAGLRRAIRHHDPETGFTHHGVLNVLAACIEADSGAPLRAVAERLATTDAVPLVEVVRARRDVARPLWTGFSSRLPGELIADLRAFGLLGPDTEPSQNPTR